MHSGSPHSDSLGGPPEHLYFRNKTKQNKKPQDNDASRSSQLGYRGLVENATLRIGSLGTSLVVQCWDSTLPMQGAWVSSLVRELNPTCHCAQFVSYASELSSNVDIMFCILIDEGVEAQRSELGQGHTDSRWQVMIQTLT